ncbi:hypothetical protein [Winogradskya consettensis]|uniref:hypothetical protein n=1 Tax=Winogradskya consettensis TaxID=113560 RepID=UPI001BB33AFC|nr:hypothetical protein [Actinoplanes consettensis]
MLREEVLDSHWESRDRGSTTVISANLDEDSDTLDVRLSQDDQEFEEWLVANMGGRIRVLPDPDVIDAIAPAALPPHLRD